MLSQSSVLLTPPKTSRTVALLRACPCSVSAEPRSPHSGKGQTSDDRHMLIRMRPSKHRLACSRLRITRTVLSWEVEICPMLFLDDGDIEHGTQASMRDKKGRARLDAV